MQHIQKSIETESRLVVSGPWGGTAVEGRDSFWDDENVLFKKIFLGFGEVAQTMYTHVSKCKSNKKKHKSLSFLLFFIFHTLIM
jgi:hypothetical protein